MADPFKLMRWLFFFCFHARRQDRRCLLFSAQTGAVAAEKLGFIHSPQRVHPPAVQPARSRGEERNPMHRPISFALLIGLIAALSLSACDKRPLDPPAPQVSPVTAASAALSVPSAAAVFASSATATKPDPTAGRSNSAMSRTQESAAMPMPGQNNDHSAPLNLPKVPASGPARR
jgi:hypothetical protein